MRHARLIGFTGPMRAGKTTAASHLVLSQGWIRMSLAQPVRRECAQMLALVEGVSAHLIEEEMRNSETKEKYRGLLQWFGIYRRRQDPDHWVKILQRRLEISLSRGFSVVVDDVRFTNEAVALRELGAKIICIESSSVDLSDHESEQDWRTMSVDAMLWNDATLEVLHRTLDDLLEEWNWNEA